MFTVFSSPGGGAKMVTEDYLVNKDVESDKRGLDGRALTSDLGLLGGWSVNSQRTTQEGPLMIMP